MGRLTPSQEKVAGDKYSRTHRVSIGTPFFTPEETDGNELVESLALDGCTYVDGQDITPYGTARQPLSSDLFNTVGVKRSVDNYSDVENQR
jgi:hypothetical protein